MDFDDIREKWTEAMKHFALILFRMEWILSTVSV